MWLIFLGINLIGLVGYNLILKKSITQKIDRFFLATIMSTGIAIPMVVALFIHPLRLSDYSPKSLLFLFFALLLNIALHTTNVKALQYLEAGVYAVLYNTRIIIATILGIVFLHERIIPLQILGGLLIFVAIFIVKQKGNKKLTTQGMMWGLAAAISLSFLNMFEKISISNLGYLGYTIPVFLLCTFIMWIIVLIRKTPVSFKTVFNKGIISLMILRAISAYGFILAFNAGAKLSVANYISSLNVILMIILGALLLNERDYLKRKLFATGIALLGITIILIANLTFH